MAHTPVATDANNGSHLTATASTTKPGLGDNVSLQRLLERAQEIKDEMLAAIAAGKASDAAVDHVVNCPSCDPRPGGYCAEYNRLYDLAMRLTHELTLMRKAHRGGK